MLVLMAVGAAFAQSDDDDYSRLDLTKGTYQLGGAATANVALVDGDTDVYLLIKPTFGMFVADRTQVYLGVDMLVDEVSGFDIGVRGGVDYFFPGQWVAPYVGAGVGYGTRQLDDAPVPYTEEGVFTALLRSGMLLPVSDTVGMEFGAEVDFNVAPDKNWWTIPLGYMGVRAFFR